MSKSGEADKGVDKNGVCSTPEEIKLDKWVRYPPAFNWKLLGYVVAPEVGTPFVVHQGYWAGNWEVVRIKGAHVNAKYQGKRVEVLL